MAKKKTRKKRTVTKESSPLYFVLMKAKKNDVGPINISDSLEAAKTIVPPKFDKAEIEVKKSTEDKKTFSGLQKEISAAIGRHLALDKLMGFLDYTKAQIQYSFNIEPTLEKYAKLVFENDTRQVYSFERVHGREIAQSLRQTTEGIEGVRQLPGLFLISLISEYDVFLHALIRAGIATQKGIIAQINRSLSLAELSQFSSIEDASEYLIEREIDAILHDHHYDQLLTVNKLFNVKVDTKDPGVRDFLAFCERRNLFTHNAGIVNSRYINKCKEYDVDIGKNKIGDRLYVNQKYYKRSISTVHEISTKLCQFLWRKLLPEERDMADKELNNVAFELIKSEDYELAERLLYYGIHHAGVGQDESKRMMVINYANAIKQRGDKKKEISELEKLDWSATGPKYQISVAAVKDDLETVLQLMPQVIASEGVDEGEFRSWPVFKNIRSKKEFQDKFRDMFGSELIAAPALAASRALRESEQSNKQEDVPIANSKPTRH